MGFIKPNNNSGGSGGGLTPQELSRLNNAYTHSKSEHAPTTAEQNVQPDWNETDTTSDAYIKNKPDLSQIGSGGNIPSVTQIEPQELDMPKVFFYGNALPTTKDNVNLTIDYISNTTKFSSFVKLKCQGTSSMSYAKKNFTVTMFSDEARTTKLKKDFKGWGAQSKFCLKANYVDTTHTRNISGARIAYDMVASRPDSEFKQQLLQCPRNGAVDGFPIKLYFNGEFYGIYTWNIPKDTWMFNMDKSNPNHIVLCAEKNTDGNSSAINSCQFRQLWTNGDGQDWSVEVGTMSEDLRTKFNRVIAFVMNATDQEFHDNIGEYFDLYSLLDYYCFSYLTCHLDGLAKNMLMVTYDGVHWGASLYDMDSIYGVSWNGASYVATNYQCPEQYQEQFSLLWQRIERCFGTELYARYLELRQGALSLSNIIKHVEEIYDVIPDRVFTDEKAKWTSLPNVSSNTMTRFRNYMRDRAVYVDTQMEEIGTPQSSVECTGISLDKTELRLGKVAGGAIDDSNKNYLENATWELGTLNGDDTSYSITDSTSDYRCQLTNLPVGTYTLHHDTYTYKKIGLKNNGQPLIGTSARGNVKTDDITFNITNPNTTVDISVFPNGVTPSGVTLTRTDISNIQEYSLNYGTAGSPTWGSRVNPDYLVVEFAVGSKTNVDRTKLVNICIGDDIYHISHTTPTSSDIAIILNTLSNKCLSSEYANVIYVCIALPKSKYGSTLDEFKTYCSSNGISNIYINKDIQSATNLLDGAEWLDGQLNTANGVILTGNDKYTKINVNTPGKYTLSSTMGYTYKKVIMYSIDDIFMYSIGDSNDTDDITLNILEPCIIRISAYPNNLDWDSTALSFIGVNFNEAITNKDVTHTLTTSDINVRHVGSQYVFTELYLDREYGDMAIGKYDGNNYKLLYKSAMTGNDTGIQALINMNNLGYTYYGSWNNKSFLYVALPIAYGTTADEILSNMTSTTITINSTDELAKLESTGGTTSEKLSAQLTATVTPTNCTQPVVWSVNPTGIVTVNNGLVTAVANGQATVTATCGSQSDTCAVTVSGMSSGDTDTTLLYSLPEETVFNGTSTYIDTGVALLSTDQDFTIALDVTATNAQTDSNATLLHCMHEESPYPGLSMMTSSNTNGFYIPKGNNSSQIGNSPLLINSSTRTKVIITKKGTTLSAYSSNGITGTSNYTYRQVSENLLIGAYQTASGVKGRYFLGTVHDFKIYNKAFTSEEKDAYLDTNTGGSGGNTGIYATAEYAITEPRTFNGTSDYIDTNIKLFDTAKTFTIFIDYASNTPTPSNQATILHCLHETSPYRGLCIMETSKDTDEYFIGGLNQNQSNYPSSGKYVISFVNGVINNIVTVDNSGNLVYSATDIGANNPYVQISENLLIGCYQDASGTKGRYWSGTINKFGVWYKQLTEAEINQVFGKSGGGTESGTNSNLVFQIDSTSMNTVDNTLTDNIAGISATLVGNPTVSGNQIAFTANDTFNFDISSLNLTNSNRTFRIKFTPTTLDTNFTNVIGVGDGAIWNNLTTSYIKSNALIIQHGIIDFNNNTVGSAVGNYSGNRLSTNPVTGQEYELVISENTDGNVRYFIDGTLVQDGTTALLEPLYISNTEGNARFIGSYSLIEIYNGYCNDYTEFTNMVNSRNA